MGSHNAYIGVSRREKVCLANDREPNRAEKRAIQFGEPRILEQISEPVERGGLFTLDRTLAFLLALIAVYVVVKPPETPFSMGVTLSP
jgi:hypothetical protein